MTGFKVKYAARFNIKKAFIGALCALFIVISLILTDSFSESIRSTLTKTVYNVIPALFPFMVLSRFMTNSGVITVFERVLGKAVARIFSVNSKAGGAVFLGFLSGFPVGTANVSQMYSVGMLSKSEAEHALCIAHNTGPAFPVSVIGAYLWGSTPFGVAVYTAQVLSAIILSRLLKDNKANVSDRSGTYIKKMSLTQSLTDAISASAFGCVNVLGFVVFWKTISDLLLMLVPEGVKFLGYAAAATLEFSSGCFCDDYIGKLSGALLTGFAVGFGGLSAMMQASYNTEKADLSLKKCVLFKITQGLVCSVFCGIAYYLIF